MGLETFVAGIDEAGRGPLAGPVTAGCVVLPHGYQNPRIIDSKKLSPAARAELYDVITTDAIAWAVASVGPRRIEKLNILQATKLAMALSLAQVERELTKRWANVRIEALVDGNAGFATKWPLRPIIKGDQKVKAIAAASILAKVSRDRLMDVIEEKFPGYGFSKHKGYPTKAHLSQLTVLGPCKAHRLTFQGVPPRSQASPKG